MWSNGIGQFKTNTNHRKQIRRGSYKNSSHVLRKNYPELTLNMQELASRKLVKMKMYVEGKYCEVLLDSCSSINIISEDILINYLHMDRNLIHGPISCILGLKNNITNDLGRINLKINCLGNEYIDEFVVIKEPGLPGDVLLSAAAMGRCGLNINYRKKIITSDDSHEEVTFCLGDNTVPVNVASLLVTDSLGQQGTNLGDHRSNKSNRSNENNKNNQSNNNINSQNNFVQNSALNNNNNNKNKNNSYSNNNSNNNNNDRNNKSNNNNSNNNQLNNSTQANALQNSNAASQNGSGNNTNSTNVQQQQAKNNNPQQINRNNRMVHCETRQSPVLDRITNTINTQFNNNNPNLNFEENFMVRTTTNVSNNTNHEVSINNEVAYFGCIKRGELHENLEENKNKHNAQIECAYFMNETAETEIHMISTNDDKKLAFKVARDVYLEPNHITKVHLISKENEAYIDNKEVILTAEDYIQDGLKMDNSLVKLQGLTCDTYVYNFTDKGITLLPGEHFCHGILLNQPTLGVTERAFFSISSVDKSKLLKEIGQVQYSEYKNELVDLLLNYRDVIALEGDKLGRTDVIQHTITPVENARPFFIPNYKLPMSRREIIDKMIKEMKADDVVRPSNSPYNSPLLLVPKKDGTWRMVIDYRKLNEQTVQERFPMPVINEVLAQLGGAKIFTSLDLLSGYWQVPLDPESKKYTAFSTHNEHLEFNVLPFGLHSAPILFSRLMSEVLGDLRNVFVYLDDFIVFSENEYEHMKTLKIVLERFKMAGLKIKVRKCQFLKDELDYLGHTINKDGIKMQQGKIRSILDYPPPVNVKGIRRFIGMIGYYRPFIKNFSTIAAPLTDLLKQDKDFVWGTEQQGAFEQLRGKLIENPILVYPDFSKDFYLATDASGTGLGAVLLQKHRTRMRVISYGSRVLNETEKRYSTTERECLALVWGLKKYKHLILGYKVHVLTDHKPLLDLFKKREFINNSKFNRWFLSVLEFNPEIKYIPGSSNTLADGLSRSHEDIESKVVNKKFCFTCQKVELDLLKVSEEQGKDQEIRTIKGDILLDENSRPDFQLINDVVYKRPREEDELPRLYIPRILVNEVLNLTHSHRLAGHPGIKKTNKIIKNNYFWPGCSKDVEMYIKQCVNCNRNKGNVNSPAPLERYPTELYPFQVVTMDFLGPFQTSYRGNKYVLVFVDHLSRWVEIVPTRDRLAATVAEAFKSRIIVRHSCPEILMSDNASEFTSEILKKLCDFYDVNKVEITPYKPSSNGAVERMNGKIKAILKSMVTPDSNEWDLALEDVQLIINKTVNETTGETPHYILYGYDKRLPVSLLDDARKPTNVYNYDDYISERLRKYYNTVKKTRELIKRNQKLWEKYYPSKEKKEIKVGTVVYVRKMVPDGPNTKLSPKFDGPYRVLNVLNNNKFKVIDEGCKERIVHYNHMKIITGGSEPQLENGNNEDVGSDARNISKRYDLRPR